MNTPTTPSIQSQHAASHTTEGDFRLSRNYSGLLISLRAAALLMLSIPALALAAAVAPPLGGAQSFAVLSGTTVTNTGATHVTGDLGVSPGSAVTGFPPGIVTGGAIHANDAPAVAAQAASANAYATLAGEACDTSIPDGTDVAGQTLTPGVYCSTGSILIGSGTLTLDAQGNPNAIWVFQMGTTIITSAGGSVNIINSGQACNVFWQVGSSATIGSGSAFQGSIFASTSITLTSGASLLGRALAINGGVTMDTNIVSVCSLLPPPTPASLLSPSLLELAMFMLVALPVLANAGGLRRRTRLFRKS
ncbi:MAG: ice-binding family protein [Methylovulum sp.]|nr:ice-binding family protein [Methylovulum sp.]